MCRRFAGAASLALAALVVAAPARAADPRPVPHVRSADAQVVKLLRDGCRRSPTFQHLVSQVEHSDVIVYVQISSQVPDALQAYLRWAGAGPVHRYVLVMVKVPTSDENLIALLGHELQHVTEVASAPDVRDEVALDALYRRIGNDSGAGYDSLAARSVGAVVRRELRGDRHALAEAATMTRADREGSEAGHPAASPASDRGRAAASLTTRALLAARFSW